MDVSSVSDCVVLDNTIPTIALDDTVIPVDAKSDEGTEELSQDGQGEDTAEDGELEAEDDEDDDDEEEDNTKYTKKEIMHIVFPNEAQMHKLGPELIEFMHQKCTNLGVDLDDKNLEIAFFEKVIDLEETLTETPMFTIDSTPSKGRAKSVIPKYDASADTMTNEMAPVQEKSKKAPRSMSCFNCEGSHNLSECPEPRDERRIRENRRLKVQSGPAARYHVDSAQKLAHFRPGHISKRLSKALGLKSKDLPVHVFKMRKLGYPPGWLADAKISHSGMNLFGSDGSAVLETENQEADQDKYDPEKIIEYPGFNVDPPEGSYDDAQMFDCPPMQPEQRKENFLLSLGTSVVKGYKRRKMNSFPMNDSSSEIITIDMDVADDDQEDGELTNSPKPPADTGVMAPPPPPPPPPGTEDNVQETTSASVNDSLIDFIMTRDANESVTEEEENKKETDNPPTRLSKDVSEGTPILKSASCYDSLPSGEKWSVGVSDVINFENLPDSVGKYEQMKELIKKVQTVVKQINNE